MKIVVTYNNADLDCVASAICYSEFLNKSGIESGYYISGIVQKEVDVVADMYNISFDDRVQKITDEDIIIVDTNNLDTISFVNPRQIVEIIDHHPKCIDVEKCCNATLKLYNVGAICSVIVNMFRENKISISRNSAILAYYGIISNTVNLKSKVTSNLDKEMINWLKGQCSEIKEEKIEEIFIKKSEFDLKDLRRNLEVEESFKLDSNVMVIGQLEVVNASSFIENNKIQIDKIIDDVYKDYCPDYVFLNFVDIFKGYHIIYTKDERTRDFLSSKMDIKFYNHIYKEEKIVLRKEIKVKLLGKNEINIK